MRILLFLLFVLLIGYSHLVRAAGETFGQCEKHVNRASLVIRITPISQEEIVRAAIGVRNQVGLLNGFEAIRQKIIAEVLSSHSNLILGLNDIHATLRIIQKSKIKSSNEVDTLISQIGNLILDQAALSAKIQNIGEFQTQKVLKELTDFNTGISELIIKLFNIEEVLKKIESQWISYSVELRKNRLTVRHDAEGILFSFPRNQQAIYEGHRQALGAEANLHKSVRALFDSIRIDDLDKSKLNITLYQGSLDVSDATNRIRYLITSSPTRSDATMTDTFITIERSGSHE